MENYKPEIKDNEEYTEYSAYSTEELIAELQKQKEQYAVETLTGPNSEKAGIAEDSIRHLEEEIKRRADNN